MCVCGRNVVYRSEHIDDDLNPYWKKTELPLEELCYGDLNWPLRVTLLDWQKNGKHRVIGKVDGDIETFQRHVSAKGNADRASAMKLQKEGSDKTKGFLIVLQFDIDC